MTQPHLINEAELPPPHKSIWKREIVSKKRTRQICAVALAICSFFWMFQPHLMGMFFVPDIVKKHPEVKNVPEPLKDTSVALSPGSQVERFGYEFTVPWVNVKERPANSVAIISSDQGSGIIFFDPSNEPNSVAIMKSSSESSPAKVEAIFGATTLRSNYDLLSQTLLVTPNQLSFFNGRNREARNMTLLMFKSMELGNTDGTIYSINLAGFKGFQIGDPSRSAMVHIKLFDQYDNPIHMLVSANGRKITQPEINSILQSLHSVPQAPAPKDAHPRNG